MVRADCIELVTEDPAAHGVFDKPKETTRRVFADVRSVGSAEFYRAKSNGLSPSLVFDLSNFAEYQGEKIVLYNGKRYAVIRTYVNGEKIEITVEEASDDRSRTKN